MHACGHDTHVAILMAVAETLVKIKEQLAGDVLFVFQPAEEGAPEGEEGGAELMLKEGLFKQKPEAGARVRWLHGWATWSWPVDTRPAPHKTARAGKSFRHAD